MKGQLQTTDWMQPAYLVHRPHVDDTVPLSRYPEDLIQDLLHVQLLTLSKIKPIHNGGIFYPQLLQHSTPGGWKKQRDRVTKAARISRHCEKLMSSGSSATKTSPS